MLSHSPPPPPRSIVKSVGLQGFMAPGRSNIIPAPPGSSRYWKLAALDVTGSSLGCSSPHRSLDAGRHPFSAPGYTNRDSHDTGLARTQPSRRVHISSSSHHPSQWTPLEREFQPLSHVTPVIAACLLHCTGPSAPSASSPDAPSVPLCYLQFPTAATAVLVACSSWNVASPYCPD